MTNNEEAGAWAGQFHKWINKYGTRLCAHCGERWAEKFDRALCKVSIGKARAGRKV